MTDRTGSAFAPRPAGPLLPTLLEGLTRDPGRPRVTWYGPGGERVELSGHVLDNWVTKSTNLLVEEFEVGPGSAVVLDLPPHWRAVVWAFAVWRAGACVLPVVRSGDGASAGAGGGLAADRAVVVTDRPDAWSSSHDVVAVSLGAPARRFEGTLPAGAMDAASAVMTYGDVLTFVQEHDPGADAVEVEGAVVPHGELGTWAAEWAGHLVPGAVSAPGRVLLEPADGDAVAVLAAAVTVLAAAGSVVLCDPQVSRELAADQERRERLVATERVSGAS
ncbi:TIGR03089 family protein [Actinotalea sp. Marseille-Q4924]|uniref:TIGR03089 family protein n=1 Tax=Actinotalea sp. Marseille-Q4924 TaxID=2866571 RepID=UPI001CE4776D|nr:TIGR03089 family protein [Actinotalea sp. Marseille-Q4924]